MFFCMELVGNNHVVLYGINWY